MNQASLVAQTLKNLPVMQDTQAWFISYNKCTTWGGILITVEGCAYVET